MPHSKDADFRDFRQEFGVPSLDALRRFPKFVQLETVSGCNARCTMCSVHSWQRSKSAMSEALFEKLLNELAAHAGWIEQVALQLGGEPLLDRHLERRVAALKRAGIRSVAFTTNASLLTPQRSRSLLEAGVDTIDFSIDGASAATFDAIRVNLSFDAVRDNVHRFLAVRRELGSETCVRVRMVIQERNAHEFDRFVAYWRAHLGPRDSVLGRFLNWWANWPQDLAGVPGALLHAEREARDFNGLPCLAPFSTLVVLSDGRVPLCCLDYNADTPMGSVVDASIADVWRGPAFEEVRAQHLARGRSAMPFCHDCHIFATGSGFEFPGAAAADHPHEVPA
jgi:pyruvate-formate lyase-activating enzyme